MNKYTWIIEKPFLLLYENINEFDYQNFNRIFFTDKQTEFGIYNNYHFFCNDKEYDFKITNYDSELIPMQFKTNQLNLTTNQSYIYSYNIGFKNNQSLYYLCCKDNQLFFIAKRQNKEKIIFVDVI